MQLQLEDGQQQQWNATKEDATVKDVFIQIFWQIISKMPNESFRVGACKSFRQA